MEEQDTLTVEQAVRKSIVHRFIDVSSGISCDKLKEVVEPLVQYILTGKTK